MKAIILLVLSLFNVSYADAQVALVKDIWPGKGHSDNSWKTEYNGKMYFMAKDSVTGVELWQYDGVNLPSMVVDLNPGPGSSGALSENQKGVITNKEFYIGASNGTTGNELYKFDGTSFTLVADIAPGPDGSYPVHLFEFNGKLFFSAAAGGYGTWRLYSYDPMTNTVHGRSFPNLKPVMSPHHFTAFNSKLYFVAMDTAFNFESCSYDPVLDTIQTEYDEENTNTEVDKPMRPPTRHI